MMLKDTGKWRDVNVRWNQLNHGGMGSSSLRKPRLKEPPWCGWTYYTAKTHSLCVSLFNFTKLAKWTTVCGDITWLWESENSSWKLLQINCHSCFAYCVFFALVSHKWGHFDASQVWNADSAATRDDGLTIDDSSSMIMRWSWIVMLMIIHDKVWQATLHGGHEIRILISGGSVSGDAPRAPVLRQQTEGGRPGPRTWFSSVVGHPWAETITIGDIHLLPMKSYEHLLTIQHWEFIISY